MQYIKKLLKLNHQIKDKICVGYVTGFLRLGMPSASEKPFIPRLHLTYPTFYVF